jgi:hypothetical protein
VSLVWRWLGPHDADVMHDLVSHLVSFSFIIALWPIWQWVTIPIMIVLAFAGCLGPNLIPF